MTLNSYNQFEPLCISIPIINDNDYEPEECFNIFFFDVDNDPLFDVIEPNQAMVCIIDDDPTSSKYDSIKFKMYHRVSLDSISIGMAWTRTYM